MAKHIAVIGGGASGLMSAILCARAGLEVSLFEQNNKLAKKILVSGNGRCNITNANLSHNDYFSQNPAFVEYALREFGFKAFEKFAASIGLLLDVKEDGRAYPLSNEAKSVAKIFEEYAKSLGVIFHTNAKINSIKEFITKYDALIVATGSRAASHLGGNSDGEEFAREFGHNIIPAYPSLVQLEIDSKFIHKMAGAKVDGEVTLFINYQKELSAKGDILFTNYGISGFAILDISQAASKALLEFSHVAVSLNLLPSLTQQQIASHVSTLTKELPHFTLLDILVGLLPLKIAATILDFLKFPHATKAKDINTKTAKKIANCVNNWRFEIEETHGFRHAEVSGGGIDTNEVNPKTMESLKQKNLYFTGEVLDIVGRRGGYNFAFAWASAYLAAQDIIKK
ncbi:NAD(P)/FAD-dependent oxidoreductase [Sulfurimonas paralvinellae]|uniref:NAD(P)/FAD-dependent oxidoreductase n=1 Tax=Sulfurimonas paralvinellae TaxID=317658 RepID=A0A7M1B8T3_9BACT|nr:NAD(P)/FAD-dependent oxidoreductase [Sulfurimonas paralvinellae]QOP46031.1 NAD(P)/FAD-dependent oxidoreductase [Sulfurimonas paralvinellae]